MAVVVVVVALNILNLPPWKNGLKFISHFKIFSGRFAVFLYLLSRPYVSTIHIFKGNSRSTYVTDVFVRVVFAVSNTITDRSTPNAARFWGTLNPIKANRNWTDGNDNENDYSSNCNTDDDNGNNKRFNNIPQKFSIGNEQRSLC